MGAAKAESGAAPKRMLKLTRVGIKVSGSILPRSGLPVRAAPVPCTPRMRLRKRALPYAPVNSPVLDCCLVTRNCLR